MSSIQVYNEWDPVEEIFVGTALHAALPANDLGFCTLEQTASENSENKLKFGPFSQKIIDETEEDLAQFVSVLQKMNIKVRRPTPINFPDKIKTLDWESEHYFCYCPRDIFLVVGNTIIETPNVCRSRYFESFSYKEILVDYMKSGSRWISAPKPRLLDSIYNLQNSKENFLRENEPVFDAANIIKAGRDLFYLVSNSGNELGLEWLKSVLGETYRVHACRNLYSGTHIDSTIALLRPGLALVNPSRVNAENLPPLLKKWDILQAPEMVKFQYSDVEPISTPWIGMNLLMLSPNLAVVDKHQAPLIKLLESVGIDVLPLLLRHGRQLAGGFHCATLDVRRTGTLEDYFN